MIRQNIIPKINDEQDFTQKVFQKRTFEIRKNQYLLPQNIYQHNNNPQEIKQSGNLFKQTLSVQKAKDFTQSNTKQWRQIVTGFKPKIIPLLQQDFGKTALKDRNSMEVVSVSENNISESQITTRIALLPEETLKQSQLKTQTKYNEQKQFQKSTARCLNYDSKDQIFQKTSSSTNINWKINKDQKNKIEEMKQFVLTSMQGIKWQNDSNFDDNSINQSQEVYLLKSIYKDRPATIFFQYPKQCQLIRPYDRTIRLNDQEVEKLELRFKIPGESPYQCVVAAFKSAGFKRTKGDSWYCMWGFISEESFKNLKKFQKVNHFPGCWHIGRKDKLWLHLSNAMRKFQNDYNFIPTTYLMQYDYERLKIRIQEAKKKEIFIMKPVASACGRGIKLINKKHALKKNKNYLVQEYIDNPHLINGYKYDLRVYVLVTSYDPLKIYIYKEGLCRFATEIYDNKKIKQRYSHLTNYSVNKQNSKFVKNVNMKEDDVGSKWSLTALKNYYNKNNISSTDLFQNINDIIIKTLIQIEPYQSGSYHRNTCFELYGFDVLIDRKLKPWLLEVNVCPSLSSSSPLDKKIKFSLLSDICNLVGFIPNHQNLKQIKNNINLNKNTGKVPINCQNILGNLEDLNHQNCLERLSTQAWKTLFDFDEEFFRKGIYIITGQFERVFPNKENVDQYLAFFQYPRFNNILLQKFLKSQFNFLTNLTQQISDQHV